MTHKTGKLNGTGQRSAIETTLRLVYCDCERCGREFYVVPDLVESLRSCPFAAARASGASSGGLTDAS